MGGRVLAGYHALHATHATQPAMLGRSLSTLSIYHLPIDRSIYGSIGRSPSTSLPGTVRQVHITLHAGPGGLTAGKHASKKRD